MVIPGDQNKTSTRIHTLAQDILSVTFSLSEQGGLIHIGGIAAEASKMSQKLKFHTMTQTHNGKNNKAFLACPQLQILSLISLAHFQPIYSKINPLALQ